MKKIFVLLLMFTLFFTVSCDDDDGGVQGEAIPRNSWLIFHPTNPPGGDEDEEINVTELEEYGKEDVRIFDKFRDVLSTGNSGWAAYRWTSDLDAADGVTDDAADPTDCDGAYKVSYLERAAENAYRFVGAGICLDGSTGGTVHNDDRIANLQKLVDDTIDLVDGINHYATPTEFNTEISGICDGNTTPDDIDNLSGINNEMGELYLFIAEVVGDSTVVPSVVSSVNVLCHPASSVTGDTLTTDAREGDDIYGDTDDSGRAYIKEAVDELYRLEVVERAEDAQGDPDPTADPDKVEEGVWSVHTAPKLNDEGGGNYDLEPDTLNNPPKLSYFRISGNLVSDESMKTVKPDPEDFRRFVVGAGIYLDENNANAADTSELEDIRSRVKEHAGVLLEAEAEAEAAEEEFNSDGTFFDNDDTDDTDFYSTAMLDTKKYIFVWENR